MKLKNISLYSILLLTFACTHQNEVKTATLTFEPLKSGFKLSKIDKDSLYEKAGLREGDVILSISGNREIKKEDLVAALSKEISEHPKSPNIEILRKDREENTYQSHYLANQEK